MGEQKKFVVGTVPYLNVEPLTYGLEAQSDRVALVADTPARLVERLKAGELDIALASSAGVLEEQGLCLVGDGGVACRGMVQSIRLFSKGQPYSISRVAVDTSSRTSVLLLKIILRERYYCRPQYLAMAPDLEAMLQQADAALLIGDLAMLALSGAEGTAKSSSLTVVDLGEEWWKLTQLPMVFAAWIARQGSNLGDLPEILSAARDAGVAHLKEIAAAAAPRLYLSAQACHQYLERFLPYRLSQAELNGLRELGNYAYRNQLITSAPDLAFYGR